jgi:NAD(P)-dependent dehydrogenase (short-subunit alcohol dehydrogenase family)
MASQKPMASQKSIAVVTGAGWWPDYIPGIGLAISQVLAEAGHRIIVLDKELEPAERSAADLRDKGHDATGMALDVADDAMAADTIGTIIGNEGRIDVLVNAAALTLARWGLKPFHEITQEQCDLEIDITLKGALNVTRHVLPHMLERESGNIICISSVMGVEPAPRMSIYGLSKAALVSFTTSLAAEAGPKGIRVNAVCPGLVKTRVTAKMPSFSNDAFVAHSALKRGCEPREIASVVGFLVSPEAGFVNGQAIRVDGGVAGII